MLESLRWKFLARRLSRGIAAVRSRLSARRAAVGVGAHEDVVLPPEDVLEAIENAVAHLPESERADARLDLLNVLAKNYDAARLPYPRWLTRLLDRSRR
ncbi:MAG TPA: hypothetical protein VHG28_20825 [Longimicrobiaceae bacterium]|nr:hypothetical protein [Longimicrobiaceae bacterium]